ncbi:flagellar filament capping protein FliD [Burkholderia thailandensis]|uniref:flagellar filament capping protein FliD n=1 Tax=Burkholderia thailandensis TaxID=57975 RepID=UPI00217CD701|nr:flagellar filament capping protein FliD [Burkholderia thailandensis]MCS6505537.1 flagellar filament capping protein FliD [Burkholderia thailandensis]
MLKVTDPQATARAFAENYMASARRQLDRQANDVKNNKEALSNLGNLLTTFRDKQRELVAGGSMIQHTVTQSNDAFASVTTASGAKPGSYQFHVEQLATAHQLTIDVPPGVRAEEAGSVKIKLADGSEFTVDLTAAKDKDGNVSAEELARVINSSSGASGAVHAAVIGGQLMLTSANTGADSRISFEIDPASPLADAFGGASTISEAQNAKVKIGDPTNGKTIELQGNTLDSIEGLSITFKQVGSGTITVASDKEKTTESVKAFIDAYNELIDKLAELTKVGDAANGDPGGPFSSDAGVRALVSQLRSELNKSVDGVKLYELGIDTDKKGKLVLDVNRFEEAFKASPDRFDKLFGDAENGLVGNLGKALDGWLDEKNGQLKTRNESVAQTEKQLLAKQEEYNRRYQDVFERYTQEFTRLQVLQLQMDNTLDQIKNLFATSKD